MNCLYSRASSSVVCSATRLRAREGTSAMAEHHPSKVRDNVLSPVEERPITAIREVKEDGIELYLGSVAFERFGMMALSVNKGVTFVTLSLRLG